jgi:hypothetical protein
LFQVFHLDAAKVDLRCCICCNDKIRMLQAYVQVLQVFQTYVANVSSGCFKVDLGVAHVAMAIHACFKCFICFRHMLQMFYLDVAKVDLMLHMLAIHACFRCFIYFRS